MDLLHHHFTSLISNHIVRPDAPYRDTFYGAEDIVADDIAILVPFGTFFGGKTIFTRFGRFCSHEAVLMYIH
tara:strand:- start:284 stop:499 length:216 start_codon:yes stop_codon:yes gene_type:complete